MQCGDDSVRIATIEGHLKLFKYFLEKKYTPGVLHQVNQDSNKMSLVIFRFLQEASNLRLQSTNTNSSGDDWGPLFDVSSNKNDY